MAISDNPLQPHPQARPPVWRSLARAGRLCAVVAAAWLAGCTTPKGPSEPPEAKSAVEAGNVYVSVSPAIAWEDIAEQLEPKQNMTIEQARTLAVQATQSQVYQFLSTFAAGLSLGLPTNTASQVTTGAADGTSSTTSTRTVGSGTVPANSGAASTAVSDAALAADLSKGPLATPVDANTLLTAAHALYQQAKILDNQISKAITPKGYRAHLVTFQVNLQPARRDYGYDTYLNLSLMPGSWKESLDTSKHFDAAPGTADQGRANASQRQGDGEAKDFPAVVFYPLIVTDALESTSSGRSVELVRQLSLSLSGVVGRIGLNAGVGSGQDSLEALLGSDKNSLITLGRINDSTLRIRIGAQNAGSTRFAMVPRTYNVSLVVLTRNKSDSDRVTSLSVISESSLASATTGIVLPNGDARTPKVLSDRVRRLVANYDMQVSPFCGAGPDTAAAKTRTVPQALSAQRAASASTPADPESTQVTNHLQLLRALDRGDYQEVNRCLQLDNPLDARRELSLRRLLAQLANVQASSRYSTLQVPLRALDAPEAPDESQLVLAKDEKTGLSVTLRGGKGLIGSAVAARLRIKDRNGVNHVLPTSMSVSGGKDVAVAFPALADLGLKAGDLADKPLQLTVLKTGTPTVANYALQLLTPAQAKPGPGNPVKAGSSVIVSDAAGNGRLTLTVQKMPEGAKGKLRITVQGADLREDRSLPTPALTSQGVGLQPESVVTLSLANLSSTQPVTITTFADDSKLGEAFTLPVERVARQMTRSQP